MPWAPPMSQASGRCFALSHWLVQWFSVCQHTKPKPFNKGLKASQDISPANLYLQNLLIHSVDCGLFLEHNVLGHIFAYPASSYQNFPLASVPFHWDPTSSGCRLYSHGRPGPNIISCVMFPVIQVPSFTSSGPSPVNTLHTLVLLHYYKYLSTPHSPPLGFLRTGTMFPSGFFQIQVTQPNSKLLSIKGMYLLM